MASRCGAGGQDGRGSSPGAGLLTAVAGCVLTGLTLLLSGVYLVVPAVIALGGLGAGSVGDRALRMRTRSRTATG